MSDSTIKLETAASYRKTYARFAVRFAAANAAFVVLTCLMAVRLNKALTALAIKDIIYWLVWVIFTTVMFGATLSWFIRIMIDYAQAESRVAEINQQRQADAEAAAKEAAERVAKEADR